MGVRSSGGGGGTSSYIGFRGNRAAGLLVVTGTWTPVPWLTEDWDTAGWHSTAALQTRVTVDRAGTFRALLSHGWDASSGSRYCALAKNGVRIRQQPGAAVDATAIWSGLYEEAVQCVAGDFLEMYVYQSSPGDLNLRIPESWFEVVYAGA